LHKRASAAQVQVYHLRSLRFRAQRVHLSWSLLAEQLLADVKKMSLGVYSPSTTPSGADKRIDIESRSIGSLASRNDYKHAGVVSPESRLLQEGVEFEKFFKKVHWRAPDWFLGTQIGQLTALLVGALLLLTLGGVVWSLGGGNATWDQSVWQSLWFSWGMFFDPGTEMGLEATEPWNIKLISVTFSVLGFTFNLLMLGLIVDISRSALEYWRRKRSRIVANGHILLLGWTDKTLFVMEELIQRAANRREKLQMVVLSELDDFDVTQQVRVHFGNPKDSKMIRVRTGSPCECADLARVSALSAKEVIILSPAGNPRRSDLATLRTVVALAAMPEPLQGNVVAEVRQAETASAISALMDVAEGVFARDAVNRVLCLMAVQPVIGDIFRQLMSWCDGVEIYSKSKKEIGCEDCTTYGEVIKHVGGGIVMGVRRPQQHAELSPPDDTVLGQIDKLLIMAKSDSDIKHKTVKLRRRGSSWTPALRRQDTESFRGNSSQATGTMVGCQSRIEKTTNPVFVIIGWPADMEEILVGFDEYVPRNTKVVILARVPEEVRKSRIHNNRGCRNLQNIKLEHRMGSMSSLHTLSDLPLNDVCSILILADDNEGEDADTADSSSLATAITVDGLLHGKFSKVFEPVENPEGGLPPIICEVLTPVLERVLEKHRLRNHCTFFHSCAVETGLFTMASSQASVYNTLLMLLQRNDFGSFTMKSVADYMDVASLPAGTPLPFADVAKAVRAKSDTLLGFCDGAHRCVVNPEEFTNLTVGFTDRLVVLTRTAQPGVTSLHSATIYPEVALEPAPTRAPLLPASPPTSFL